MIIKQFFLKFVFLFALSLSMTGCYQLIEKQFKEDDKELIRKLDEQSAIRDAAYKKKQEEMRAERLKESIVWEKEREVRMAELDYSRFKAYNLPRCAENIALGRTEAMSADCLKYQGRPEVLERVQLFKQGYKYFGEPTNYTGTLKLGMTAKEVLKAWGRPSDINTTENNNFYFSQWVYQERESYLYFENGILTTIQE
jgi:hypothetical protein